jgi:hypothetical protein
MSAPGACQTPSQNTHQFRCLTPVYQCRETRLGSHHDQTNAIGGFTANGNVIAYDPASDTDALVRHVYDREQFERAWIPASGGIVYVIRTAGTNINSLLTANNS